MTVKILNKAIMFTSIVALAACGSDSATTVDTSDIDDVSTETGASISQGPATTTETNLFTAGIRIAASGTIGASDGSSWTVPAATNFTNDDFPFAPDLYNVYGEIYTDATSATAALQATDVVTIDEAGELITAYVFADNYFELYINGVAVAKDAVPFTDFNSHLVQFRVEKPFTIAMQLVDWEENLGLGSENTQGFSYFPGDGGMVAIFTDESDATVASTGSEWKAQTYYISPVMDQSCVVLSGDTRDSSSCSTAGSNDGSAFYAFHWPIDTDWTSESYDDSTWPAAVTYTNDTVGVDNKPSYTTFTDVFDDATNDAEFIWSSNLILDNSVLVRYTVE